MLVVLFDTIELVIGGGGGGDCTWTFGLDFPLLYPLRIIGANLLRLMNPKHQSNDA